MTVEVPLTRGMVALIDDIDADRVLRLKWSVHASRGGKFYARHAWIEDGVWKHVKMHRFILGLGPRRPYVDHKNGNGLDNRRENIRIATHSQNLTNSGGYGRLGFKGVTDKGSSYVATINRDGERIYLGTYDKAEDAARIYDAAALMVHGEFAWTNYPDIDPACADRVRRILDGDTTALPSRRESYIRTLTDADVIAARRRYLSGGVLIRELAAEFGVTPGCIGHALNGRTFKHIQNPPPITRDKRRIEVPA